jgi:phosphatidylglycerol:prolipoprotein diacylglycerol transferase
VLENASPYSWLLLAGITVTLWWWTRLARRDERLLLIYLAALVGAFLGAKLVYLAAEGWMYWNSPDRWRAWATGKTILGAMLGGYASVELAKRALGYRAATGDFFAIVAPVGIILGRVGCLLHGCCLGRECAPHWWALRDAQGVARWPAVPAEIGFNLLALGVFVALHSREAEARGPTGNDLSFDDASSVSAWPHRRGFPALRGQHFHLYLIGYGLFRFGHEFLRATPPVAGSITGYQIAALAVVGLGVLGFIRRHGTLRPRPAFQ